MNNRTNIVIPTPPGRKVAPGVHVVGGCFGVAVGTRELHNHLSAYVVDGGSQVAMIDTGHPKDWHQVEDDLDRILDGRELDFVFPTHEEFPHAGNLSRILDKYPSCIAVGEVRDWHLYMPEHSDRIRRVDVHDSVVVGEDVITILPGLIHDLPWTYWFYSHRTRALFVSDGFAYSHEHDAAQCRLLASELPDKPDSVSVSYVNKTALYWTAFVDTTQLRHEILHLMEEYPPSVICPAHGSVIDSIDDFVPLLLDGLQAPVEVAS